jgi:bacterial/archaeal transporter family protein
MLRQFQGVSDEIRRSVMANGGPAVSGIRRRNGVFVKVGIEQINSDFATFIRTMVILLVLGGILVGTRQWQPLASVSGRTYFFLVLSGLATGGPWLCYFRALKPADAGRAAPLDKLSIVLVAVFGVIFLGERLSGIKLGRHRPYRDGSGPGVLEA